MPLFPTSAIPNESRRHPEEILHQTRLQTLKASPLSNRRSERPAENSAQAQKHSEGVPHLRQKNCTTYHKIKKTTCFYISKVFQNAIFLFFIYNDIVLFYAYPVFYKRLAVYLGGRSNGLPTMPLLSAYFNSSSQLNHTPNFQLPSTSPQPTHHLIWLYFAYILHIPNIYLAYTLTLFCIYQKTKSLLFL